MHTKWCGDETEGSWDRLPTAAGTVVSPRRLPASRTGPVSYSPLLGKGFLNE